MRPARPPARLLALVRSRLRGRRAAPGAGSLSVEDGRGTVVLRRAGLVIGRLDERRRSDRRPDAADATHVVEAARVNGVLARRRPCRLRAARTSTSTSPGGRYKSSVRGRGISTLRARARARDARRRADAVGSTGRLLAVDDDDCRTSRRAATTLPFGPSASQLGDAATERRAARRDRQPADVLVVEDEASIASFVSLYLKNAGYGVRAVGTGAGALNAVAAEMPALIVLDLNLPDMDGIEICRRIRKSSDVPILMLTARDEDVDKIIGLEVGADDYLTKPFNPRELVARVKSVLRRATPDRRSDESDEIRHGDLVINAGRREVHVGDDEIQLAPEGVRPPLGAARPPRARAHARPAARARLGLHVRRRHAHGRRPRAADPPQARRRVADRHRLGRRLQGRARPHGRARRLWRRYP